MDDTEGEKVDFSAPVPLRREKGYFKGNRRSVMEKDFSFYKEKKTDRIWWVYRPDVRGRMEISFDRKKILNLFEDYPWRFTPEEKELFDKENPYWANFFKSRT